MNTDIITQNLKDLTFHENRYNALRSVVTFNEKPFELVSVITITLSRLPEKKQEEKKSEFIHYLNTFVNKEPILYVEAVQDIIMRSIDFHHDYIPEEELIPQETQSPLSKIIKNMGVNINKDFVLGMRMTDYAL